jgi:hypothetical protein
MAYRYRFYPPEIDDWDDPGFAGREIYYVCNPVCCPNPNCYPQTCVPSTNYATCCPNPNSIYNGGTPIVSACSPECNPTCNPRSFCRPRYCYPRGGYCRPTGRW